MGNLLKTLTLSSTILVAGLISTNVTAAAEYNHTFTTELQEVRAGSINGKEYLTLHIDSFVGPANCQGSVLRVNSHSISQPGKQEAMESIALEAMLRSEKVILTVPLNYNRCVDGMPTVTDIDLVVSIQ